MCCHKYSICTCVCLPFCASVFVDIVKTNVLLLIFLYRYIKNIRANFQEWMANSLKTDAKVCMSYVKY